MIIHETELRRTAPPPSAIFAGLIFVASMTAPAFSQTTAAWKDPSPHRASFVTVDPDLRLEVLDWGGSGKAIVLLAGLGNTAHVFDDFAPKLTGKHHVYGITRRGFGASEYSGSEYGADRLGDDVVAVIDALKLKKAVLVGHSLGGEELSSVANRHPDRVAGLVYLDAGYWYAFDNGKVPDRSEYQAGSRGRPPQPPSPGEAELASFSAYTQWNTRLTGIAFPESELHQSLELTPDGRVGKRRNPPAGAASIATGMKKYATISGPVLAIFAISHRLAPWIKESSDPEIQKTQEEFAAKQATVAQLQAKAFEEGVPTARVVRIADSNHYVFLSNQSQVLREMQDFLSHLRW